MCFHSGGGRVGVTGHFFRQRQHTLLESCVCTYFLLRSGVLTRVGAARRVCLARSWADTGTSGCTLADHTHQPSSPSVPSEKDHKLPGRGLPQAQPSQAMPTQSCTCCPAPPQPERAPEAPQVPSAPAHIEATASPLSSGSAINHEGCLPEAHVHSHAYSS